MSAGEILIAGLVCFGPFSSPVRAQDSRVLILEQAYDDFLHHRYRQAADSYSRVLAVDPEDADALLGRGWSRYYLGLYDGAAADFKKVLAAHPENASAKQGLALCPKTLALAAGYYYAGLHYQNISSKSGGRSIAVPVSLAYKNKWTLGWTYSHTIIHLAPPATENNQSELIYSGSYHLTPRLSLIGAFDHLTVNDPTTGDGKIYTGGLNYVTALRPGSPRYISLGGSYSYSRYSTLRAVEYAPHLGLGTTGAYLDFSMTQINDDKTSENLSSGKALAALGPFHGLTFTASGYIGKKRMPVEEWGTLVANNQDLYRGGWRAGLFWNWKDLTIFGIYGKDNVRANMVPASTTDYTSVLTVGGASYNFGYSKKEAR